MNTPTHILVGMAAFSKPGEIKRNSAIFAAALIPDLSIFILYFWGKFIMQVGDHQIWRELYWQEPWQTYGAISNSIPLYALLLAIGLWQKWSILTIIALTALLHLALDLPFHATDAHKHFWPITDWRFHSPLSYWDVNHHGDWVARIEIIFGFLLTALLFIRFKSFWVRSALALALLSYIAVPLFFYFTLGG